MKTKKISVRLQMLVIGILVIGVGKLLLAFNMGLLPDTYKHIIFSWPMLIIAIGLVLFFHRPPQIFGGLIVILTGAFFLASKLDYPALGFVKENLWAIILILGGTLIFFRSLFAGYFRRKRLEKHEAMWQYSHEYYTGETLKKDEAGYIYHNYIFGGGKEKPEQMNFKGGEINCVFGGMELDLTNTILEDGINTLTIDVVFGGVVLYLPVDWKIELRQQSVFGHFEDKRPKPAFELDNNKTLIIQASCVFGGGEIKSHA